MTEKTKIDPLHLVGVKAVQRDLRAAQQKHDGFMLELFKRYGLDVSKHYIFADDGSISEVPSLAEVRESVEEIHSKIKKEGFRRNGNR